MTSLVYLLPLLSAVVYVFAALFLKRASQAGANVWHTTRWCNYATALFFAPLWLLGGNLPGWEYLWQPALVAALFVAGQVFTVLALRVGDVSVATPVLGVKILLVGLFTVALNHEHLGVELWIAAALSSAAIALLHLQGAGTHHRVGTTILLAVSAAMAYALFDVLVQKFSPTWGAGRFLPIMMGIAGIGSLLLRPFAKTAPSHENSPGAVSRKWMLGGAFCLAFQAVMLVSSIAIYRQATVANVMYSSRGLWSVLAVWLIGHWFGNSEHHHGTKVLTSRLIGATLLLAAILLVLMRK